MTVFRAACVQMNSGNDMPANLDAAERLIAEAAAAGAQLIALPENAFFMRASDEDDMGGWREATHPGILLCRDLAKRHGAWILAGSIFAAEGDGARRRNRSLLVTPEGGIAAAYDKIHLFDVTLAGGETYRESARIAPGDRLALAELPWGRLGMSVCYDLRFPHLYRDLAIAGADILSIPAAFTHTTGKAHWHVLLRARAIETGCFVIAPAQAGAHPGGRRTYGHSLIVGPWGEVLAEGDGETVGVIWADLDMGQVSRTRRALPSLLHDRPYPAC